MILLLQIEELKKQLEITDQQSRQVSDEQKKFEKKTSNLDAKLHHLEQMLQDNDVKYREEVSTFWDLHTVQYNLFFVWLMSIIAHDTDTPTCSTVFVSPLWMIDMLIDLTCR